MKPTTKALCAAHSTAYRKHALAREALNQIDQPDSAAIHISVTQPGVGATRRVARDHETIDDICSEYIEHSRKEGVWGWYHNPRRGRLDSHGVFHDLDAKCCPVSGDVLVERADQRPKFDEASLAAYRERIAEYHQRFDVLLAEERARDVESGWADAWETCNEARADETRTWDAVLARAAICSRSDLTIICRHQRSQYSREIWRLQRSTAERKRPFGDIEDEHLVKAQEIVRALAKPRAGKTK